VLFLDEEIYVSEPLSSRKVMEILEKHPNLKRIKCPPSIYKRISSKYVDALSKLGVEIEPVIRKGRPKKYGESEIKIIEEMQKEGYNFQEISDKLHIPLKTVYYLNKNPLKRGRNRKYTPETKKEVKNLHKKGLSALDISKKLKMPLRTVYGFIKR